MRRLALVALLIASLILAVSAAPPPAAKAPERPAQSRRALILGPQPDLRVTRIEVLRQECQDPLCLRVRIDLRNQGEATSGPFIVRVGYRVGSSQPWRTLEDFRFAAQAHNHDTSARKLFTFKESGSYEFRAEIDPDNVVQTAAPTKIRQTDPHHYDAGIPDLVVRAINSLVCRHAGGWNYDCSIKWKLENAGDGKAAGYIGEVVECSLNSSAFKKMAESVDHDLAAGAVVARESKFRIAPHGFQSLRCKVTVDDTNHVRERSETNNTAQSETYKP